MHSQTLEEVPRPLVPEKVQKQEKKSKIFFKKPQIRDIKILKHIILQLENMQ